MGAKVAWAVWMTAGGIAAAVVTYLLTANWWWTLAALLASGVALNAIGQMVTQPLRAARRPRDHAAQ